MIHETDIATGRDHFKFVSLWSFLVGKTAYHNKGEVVNKPYAVYVFFTVSNTGVSYPPRAESATEFYHQ